MYLPMWAPFFSEHSTILCVLLRLFEKHISNFSSTAYVLITPVIDCYPIPNRCHYVMKSNFKSRSLASFCLPFTTTPTTQRNNKRNLVLLSPCFSTRDESDLKHCYVQPSITAPNGPFAVTARERGWGNPLVTYKNYNRVNHLFGYAIDLFRAQHLNRRSFKCLAKINNICGVILESVRCQSNLIKVT